MSDKYFKARQEFEWKRNTQWKGIPQDDGNGNKLYLIYAVIEDNPNEIGLRVNGDSVVNWGDGNSETTNGGTYTNVYHVYDYATVTGTILTLDDGRNYKNVLIDLTYTTSGTSPEYLFYIWYNSSSSYSGSNNILECVSYLGDGVSINGPGSAKHLFGLYSYSTIVEHISIKTPSNSDYSQTSQFRYCKQLKKLELPDGYFHTGTYLLYTFWAASLYGHNFGDIHVNRFNNAFRYIDNAHFGDIIVDSSMLNDFIHANNYSIKSITALNNTNGYYLFGGTVNNGANSIGLIDMPLLEDVRYMFRRSQMPEVVFTDCSNFTVNDSMFYDCYAIQKLIMPGLIIGVDVNDSNLTADAIDAFFTSVGTASGAQTLDVSDNPGSATCDTTIATTKGWTVIT